MSQPQTSTQGGILTRQEIITKCAHHGLAGVDAETAIDHYMAAPAGGPYNHDSIRVATILNHGEKP